jgi:hypothetical protein
VGALKSVAIGLATTIYAGACVCAGACICFCNISCADVDDDCI